MLRHGTTWARWSIWTGDLEALFPTTTVRSSWTRRSATYHSNLGTAYLGAKEISGAQKQFEIALKLDPEMFDHRGTAGVTAHMFSPEDHARFCFEMAQMYAEHGDEAEHAALPDDGERGWLRCAGRDGRTISALARYRKDPRVLLLVRNARALRSGRASADGCASAIPPLPPTQQE